MPLPVGISSDGTFADSIDAETMQQLSAQGAGGGVSHDILKAKGTSADPHFGLLGGEFDADHLDKAGWAIMFGTNVSDAIKKNLSPLIELRKKQVGNPALFKTLDPPAANKSASAWLEDQHNSLNVVDPAKGVPYYVLIVASPDDISFEFQYELDLYWAVGRLWLQKPADFERYAQSVVDYETKPGTASRKIVLFAPDFDGKDNGAGKLVSANLIQPMIAAGLGQAEKFPLQSFLGKDATKNNLQNIFTASEAPALMFTASHGLLEPAKSDDLPARQGAVLCQDYQGGAAEPDSYYEAADLPKNAKLRGSVHFLFSCYGVGCPRYDTYNLKRKVTIAPAPMMARLPQELLSRENGALAVLGHIDRAWSSSYVLDGQPQEQGFRSVLTKLMSGNYRLGSATDQFNFRWAALSIPLADTLQKMQTKRGLEEQAAHWWVRRDDARNYILHGDPAVKLRVGGLA